MRLSKAWIIASKDFRTFFKRKSILYTIVWFELVVSIGLPIIIHVIAGKPAAVALLPVFINSFSFLYVIGAALLPATIASYSLVGEKVQKSLEPLLATPTTDEEILAGKSLAAFVPAMASTFIGASVFMALVDIFTGKVLGRITYPNWDIAIIVLLLAPLACILSIGFNVLVSSRSNDVRASQQVGVLIMLPFGAVYLLSEFRVLSLTTEGLLIMAVVLAIVDVVMFWLVKATFQREEILTRWK
jgi:ABC-2 type transport system permease protein